MKFLVGPTRFLTVSTPILPAHGITSDLSLGTVKLSANLSRNYLVACVPQNSPSLAYMNHTESEFSFNLELASVYKKAIKNHNFLGNPSGMCDCGDGYEDNTHFFTKCDLYAVSRTSLLRSISNILVQNDLQHVSLVELTQLYLYVHSNLPTSVNRLVFQSSKSTFMTLSGLIKPKLILYLVEL